MLFSLINTLVTFQAYINKVLSRLINYFIVIYLNNILIYSKLKKDYYTYIRIIIKRLKKHKLYIKLNKCFFNIIKVEFLGFIINSLRVKPNLNKILTIKKWLKLKSFYEV